MDGLEMARGSQRWPFIYTGFKNKTIGTIVSDTYLDVCGLYVIVHGSI